MNTGKSSSTNLNLKSLLPDVPGTINCVSNPDGQGMVDPWSTDENGRWWCSLMEAAIAPEYPHSYAESGPSLFMQQLMSEFSPPGAGSSQPASGPSRSTLHTHSLPTFTHGLPISDSPMAGAFLEQPHNSCRPTPQSGQQPPQPSYQRGEGHNTSPFAQTALPYTNIVSMLGPEAHSFMGVEQRHQDFQPSAQPGESGLTQISGPFSEDYHGLNKPPVTTKSQHQQHLSAKFSPGRLSTFCKSPANPPPRRRGYTPPPAPRPRYTSIPPGSPGSEMSLFSLSSPSFPKRYNQMFGEEPSVNQTSTDEQSHNTPTCVAKSPGSLITPSQVTTADPRDSSSGLQNVQRLSNVGTSSRSVRTTSESILSQNRDCPTVTEDTKSTPFAIEEPFSSSSQLVSPQVIGQTTPLDTIIKHLVNHGCADVTAQLKNIGEHSKYSGGLSDVYQARWSDGRPVAVKCLRALSNSDVPHCKLLKHTARELYTWSRASHPNILELYGLAMVRGKLAMIAPWMEYGSILAYVRAQPQVDRCKLCAQVASGLSYMHGLGLVHGDIKGNNVVVSEDGTAKLTDFGSATMAREFAIAFTATQTTNYSIRWAAPELFESKCPGFGSDVYSFAKTVLEALTGDIPHKGLNDFAIMRSVGVEGKLPDRPKEVPLCSRKGNQLWEMLTRCWHLEPENRPNIIEVYELVRHNAHLRSGGVHCTKQ